MLKEVRGRVERTFRADETKREKEEMIIGKVKQDEMTLREFLDACEENEKVFCLTDKCFVRFDKFDGIKVRWIKDKKEERC
jgi:hypothetical protein